MNENIITWSVTNWITILLMVGLGFAVLALAAQGFHAATGSSSSGS